MSDGLRLLGAIVDSGSVHTLRDLPPELFIGDEVGVYDFLRLHYRRYGNIPAITTVEEETGTRLPAAPETIAYYTKRVHDRRLYGIFKDRYNLLKTCLRDNDMDRAKEVVDDLRAATRVAHTETDVRTIGEATQDVLRLYQEAHDNPGVTGVPSGWQRFDSATGGYQPGDVITFVARPGLGKTYLLLQQARAAYHAGYSVLIVTMEMSIEGLARRFAAMEAGINTKYLLQGTLSTHTHRRLASVVATLQATDRLRLFSGALKKKVSDVELLAQEYSPDIIFIDGVYMMNTDNKRNLSKIDRISEVFDDVKKLALSQNLPVVVTSQFNRQAGKRGREGSLENIAYTDAISTHSSLAISVGEGKGHHADTRRVLNFLKGREGESGEYHVHYTFAPMNMSEVSIEDIQQEETEGPQSVASVDWMV